MSATKAHYLVCILAHNEECIIRDTIESVLAQRLEPGARLDVYVFTNGCTDGTDALVQKIARENAGVHLVSLSQKGKVHALRQSVAYLRHLHDQQPDFDRVFYADADIRLLSPDTLQRLSRTLDSSDDLYLVSSYPVSDPTHIRTSWYLQLLSEIRQDVQSNLHANLVRGACYVIRFSVLTRVGYPQQLLSDDMFLELRLNGHFVMDYDNPTATKCKGSLRAEIERDLFTLIAREQIYSWNRRRMIDSLDPESARREWSLQFGSPHRFFWCLLRRGKLLSLAVMATWLPIYKFNEHRAKLIFEESQRQQRDLLEYWVTQR